MKKYLLSLGIFVFCAIGFGDNASLIDAKTQSITPVSSNDKELFIKLYDAPSPNAKVIKQLSVNADLVPIYHKSAWMKVGDRADGVTGWVDLKQYKTAKHDFYQHYFSDKIDSVYLRKQINKDGKTTIEAYQDGKKLSEAEAKKLYRDMQKREQHQWEAIQRFNQLMNEQMRQEYLDARRALDEAFAPSPVVPDQLHSSESRK